MRNSSKDKTGFTRLKMAPLKKDFSGEPNIKVYTYLLNA
jgi:hypothetical protein